MADRDHVAWLVELASSATGSAAYIWQGDHDITFGGQTWTGAGGLVNISEVEGAAGPESRRAQISLNVGADPTLRTRLLVDHGPVAITIRWIKSSDGGETWTATPLQFVGRLSTSTMRDGVLTAEIETYTGDIDRGRPVTWSYEEQLRRHPGDAGLEFMRSLESGVDIRWPP